jgi:predicted nucleic acid-binding protein
MGSGYLIDTNTVIDFSANRLPDNSREHIAAIIDDSPKISVINKIELLGFRQVPEQIIAFTENAFVISIDNEIVAQTITLRKQHKIKLPDAIIAATALVFDLILITNNSSDFKAIGKLELMNPYTLV